MRSSVDDREPGRAEELFEQLLSLPGSEREGFLAAHCDDPDLRLEVHSLLSFHVRAESFLVRPLAALPCATRWAHELLSGPVPELRPGDTVGSYVVIERIGEGGMGAVYLAHQCAPVQRRVALKVLKWGSGSREAWARFALESQALARMDHPHVARVLGAGTTADGRPYFAMEHVPGTPLVRYCDEHRLGLEQRLRLFLQVCAGVQHVHDAGILHRDLKPSNVLVREDDGQPSAKIIDFGVAKALAKDLADPALHTSVGGLIGTPDYMSPEQAQSDGRDVDTRADVYSLGAILYELLAGRLPHELRSRSDLTYLEIQRVLAQEDPLAPSRALARHGARAQVARGRSTTSRDLGSRLRGDLDWIVLRSLEKDRARRYSAVSELSADLQRYLRHEPVLAAPQGRLYHLDKFARRNRVWIAVFAVLVLALAGVIVMASDLARARRRADAQSDYLLPLADYGLWRALVEEADRLWPPVPERVPALDSWLERAREITARREQHAALLRQPRGNLGLLRPATGWTEEQAYRSLIADLVAGLDALLDRGARQGSLEELARRRGFASTIQELSLVRPADLWRAAIASISDPSECPAYRGAHIRPQLGIVPLCRDRSSGLWEFLHLQSGAAPRRDDGQIVPSEDLGIVLVLLPGGSFDMGARRAGVDGDHGQDQNARSDEEPVHRVSLDPFFISKYELTRGQWQRLGGDPSLASRGTLHWSERPDLRHPALRISWNESAEILRRGNLALPTEAQWEYAARAGTTTPYCTGIERDSLQGAANVSDLSTHPLYPGWRYEGFDDGFPRTAPVGSFTPNGFGLHDVHGNASEWMLDDYLPYSNAVRPGDGLRLPSDPASAGAMKVCRGGAWDCDALGCRVSRRLNWEPDLMPSAGLRPVRALER